MKLNYLPEIDGLRAIAVLAVVAFHAGLGGAGYVGVDVFFVISGYLITLLLLDEWQSTGSISLVGFYGRRVRRILPAAIVVTLVVVIVSMLLLSPDQQVGITESASASLAFVANVFFQMTTGGYFDTTSGQLPLLHLWSLSVEEQFYFFWPFLLCLFFRYTGSLLYLAIVTLGLASLALAELLIATTEDAAFYQMPARFWELAAGGLIATLPKRRLPPWILPLGIIGVLMACTRSTDHFPGIGALPSVIAASLIIAAVHGGARNRLLASRPMVAIGLISYSLYLWHWPLLAFYDATSIGEGSVETRLILCGIAFVFAFASYRYIEQPFRRLQFPPRRTVAVGIGLTASFAAGAYAVGIYQQDLLTAGNPLAYQAEHDRPDHSCHASNLERTIPKCAPKSDTLVWGDSMAYAWMPAFPGASQATRDACPPFMDYVNPRAFRGDELCLRQNQVVARLAGTARTVVLAARWASYDRVILDATFKYLRQVKRVIVIGPTPELRDNVPQCLRRHAEAECAISITDFVRNAKPVLTKLRKAAEPYPNIEVVDMTEYLCTATKCPPVKDGVPLYWDSHHISVTAAQTLSTVFHQTNLKSPYGI